MLLFYNMRAYMGSLFRTFFYYFLPGGTTVGRLLHMHYLAPTLDVYERTAGASITVGGLAIPWRISAVLLLPAPDSNSVLRIL